VTGSESSQWWTLLAYLPATSAITFHATTLSEPLFIFLLMLNLLAVVQYVAPKRGRIPGYGHAIWVGVTFAALLLTRPIALLLWIPHACFIALIQWKLHRRIRVFGESEYRLRYRAVHFAIAAGTVFLILSPWVIRNQSLFGKPFLTEFTGRNLWIVAFQEGSGSGFEIPQNEDGNELSRRLKQVGLLRSEESESWRQTWSTAGALSASGLNDYQTDRLMKGVASEAIRRRPQEFGEKAIRRTVNFWRTPVTDLPTPAPDDDYGNQRRWSFTWPPIEAVIQHRLSRSVAFNTGILFAIAISLIGLIVHQPTRNAGVWLGLVLAYFSVITGILEIPAYRYRMVVEPVAAIAVGAMAGLLWDRLTQYRKYRRIKEVD
jgi:hypothetical protein